MSKRIYYVNDGRSERLVRTTHPSRAVAHVSKDMLVRVATQDDLETLLEAKVKVEEADSPLPQQKALGLRILPIEEPAGEA